MRKALALILLGTMFAAGTALAADPIVGTWTLNTVKSKFKPGPGPKAMTRVYTESNGVYTLAQTATSADGKDSSMEVHYRNGKEEPQAGNPDFDSVAARRIDANVWDFKLKKGGTVVGHVHRVVAPDGKSMVVHNTSKRPDGTKTDDALLFVKQ